jgi:hypothetical protein
VNRIEHLLTILGEECAEVAVRCSKAKRFGLQEVQPGHALTNAQRIMAEVQDVFAALEMLGTEGALETMVDPVAIDKKIAKVEEFLLYSKECGTLDGDA